MRRRLAATAALAIILSACEEEAPVDPSTLPPTDVPADATILSPEIKADQIVREVAGDRSLEAYYIDQWLPPKGWQGEVLGVKRSGGITRFSVRMDESTVAGDVNAIAEAPLDDLVEAGGLVRFRGRISGVVITNNAPIKAHEIHLDRVSIIRFQKPG